MNAYQQAQQAYASANRATVGLGRSAEYKAFSDIIKRLSAAAKAQPQNFSDIVSAVHDNRSLWTILASDVASADNALPQVLRAQIFYLAEFTDHHSRKVLRGQADVSILIEINSAVLRGLAMAPAHEEGVA